MCDHRRNRSSTHLELLLPGNGRENVIMYVVVDRTVHFVLLRESVDLLLPVLVDSLTGMTGNTNLKCSVSSARENAG